MNIIVLIKQVPDTESAIEVTPDSKSILADNLNWVLNPYDEIAVEEALRIKEAMGGSVTLLCAGPKQCQDALRSGLAMGADRAVLLNDPALESCDHTGLARALAGCLRNMDYELILAGQRAVDDDLQLLGPAVAHELGIPSIPNVIRQEINNQTIRCDQRTDQALITVESALPVVMAVQRGLNEPRYVSLPGMMKAKKKPIEEQNLTDLGLEASFLPQSGVRMTSLRVPASKRAGEMIPGETPEELVANLTKRLGELAII